MEYTEQQVSEAMKINPNLAEIVEVLFQKGFTFAVDMVPYNKTPERIEHMESEGKLLLGLSDKGDVHYAIYREASI